MNVNDPTLFQLHSQSNSSGRMLQPEHSLKLGCHQAPGCSQNLCSANFWGFEGPKMAISLSKIVQNWRFLRIFGDYFAKPCLRIVGFETGGIRKMY